MQPNRISAPLAVALLSASALVLSGCSSKPAGISPPDIDADVFKDQILPKIQGAAKRMTMYASSGDTALQVSQRINGNDRLGLSGDRIMVLEGIDTVDASEIDTSMIGHGYYGSHKVVVEDILNLIIRGLDPPNRELVPGEVGEWDFRKLVN